MQLKNTEEKENPQNQHDLACGTYEQLCLFPYKFLWAIAEGLSDDGTRPLLPKLPQILLNLLVCMSFVMACSHIAVFKQHVWFRLLALSLHDGVETRFFLSACYNDN